MSRTNVLLYARPGLTPYWEMRLFRNDPAIRFRGVMHENIWPGIEAYRARRGGHVGKSPLVIDHRGYEGDQQPKHWRNPPLLARALREDLEARLRAVSPRECLSRHRQGAPGRARLGHRRSSSSATSAAAGWCRRTACRTSA